MDEDHNSSQQTITVDEDSDLGAVDVPIVDDDGEDTNHKIIENYTDKLTYEKLCESDHIDLEIAPEKKGLLFSSYREYFVKSRRLNSSVERRYTDFESFHELLIATYPYRLVPKLPPKGAIIGANNSEFLEERLSGLKRWLNIVALHPILNCDPITHFFLTYTGPKMNTKILEIYKRMPDEFTTSNIASKSKELVQSVNPDIIPSSRKQIKVIQSGLTVLKKIADRMVLRSTAYAKDLAEIGNQLLKMACDPHNASEWAAGETKIWEDTKRGFGAIADDFSQLYSRANDQALRQEEEVCEQLNLLSDLLTAHQLLCERYDKGVAADHQRAIEKLTAYKNAKLQKSFSRNECEAVAELELKMVEQEETVADIELRRAFFFHCMKLETQLVQVYLGNMARVLDCLITSQLKGHTEMAEVWNKMPPRLLECTPHII